MNPALENALAAADAAMELHGEGQPQDGRAVTSPANGHKGGRPAIDWGLLADTYQKEFGAVRYYKGAFFEFDAGRGAYKIASRDEMGARAGAFLRSGASPIFYTANAERNLVGALRASRDSFAPPCFLDTGAPAAGWAAMRNGLLDIEAAARGEAGALTAHTPNFFSTRFFAFDWDAGARCPRFDRFLSEVLPDPDAREMAELLAGLLLVPETCYNVFFILLGDGGCGKTTFFRILGGVLGAENVCAVPLGMLAEKHTTHRLTRTLANLVDDSATADSSKGSLASVEGALKSLTGGGLVHCEPKGVDPWEAPATARCVFCQNGTLPVFVDRSNGIWDRLRVIQFPMRFRGRAEQNPRLAEEIIAEELPGVFALAVRGLGRLRQLKTFPQCAAGAAIVEEHRGTCDTEKLFLEGRYRYQPGAFTPSGELYRAYSAFCAQEGFPERGGRNFTADGVRRVFPGVRAVNVRREGKRVRGYENLAEIPDFE